MQEIAKKLKITYNNVKYSLQRPAQTRLLTRMEKRCGRWPAEREDKNSSLYSEKSHTGPSMRAPLKDADLLDKVAKTKPHLKLANEITKEMNTDYGQRKTNLSLRCGDDLKKHLQDEEQMKKCWRSA